MGYGYGYGYVIARAPSPFSHRDRADYDRVKQLGYCQPASRSCGYGVWSMEYGEKQNLT